jgi:microsomal dipeptidase-like Zn-dependent dipeptidase
MSKHHRNNPRSFKARPMSGREETKLIESARATLIAAGVDAATVAAMAGWNVLQRADSIQHALREQQRTAARRRRHLKRLQRRHDAKEWRKIRRLADVCGAAVMAQLDAEFSRIVTDAE